jgi:hypothetical protein
MSDKGRPEFAKRPDAISLTLVLAHVAFTLAPVYWAPEASGRSRRHLT